MRRCARRGFSAIQPSLIFRPPQLQSDTTYPGAGTQGRAARGSAFRKATCGPRPGSHSKPYKVADPRNNHLGSIEPFRQGRPLVPRSAYARQSAGVSSQCVGPNLMKTQDECWRLARDCANWAAQYNQPDVRDALLQMAKSWARLALQADSQTAEPTQTPPAPPCC